MGSEGEEASSSTPTLPLFSMHCSSPEPLSGMLTPLHTSASVPFRWEEEPGKPLSSSTALVTTCTPNPTKKFCLELPPRLQLQDHHRSSSKMTKTPSPTTVLDGPYLGGIIGIQSSSSSSSSFRFIGRRHHHGAGSFGGSYDNESPERVQFGGSNYKGRGFFFGSWRITKPAAGQSSSSSSKDPAGEGSFVFATSPSSLDYLADFGGGDDNNDKAKRGKKISRSRLGRNGSLSSSVSRVRSHLWATIYQGLKQVVPWKGRENQRKKGSSFEL